MVKINFCDMYKEFNKIENIFMRILEKHFTDIQISDEPDFLIYGPFGTDHYKYHNCVKIFYTGEPVSPDFNQCDYAIAFDPISFGKRYFRRPVWIDEIMPNGINIDNETALNRRFCNFIYSNDTKGEGAYLRKEFAKKLMKYKRVDCPGKVLNNMPNEAGSRMEDWRQNKLNFIAGYKFTIAFENAACDGYTTEKMTQPLSVHSIPIYWGNPAVGNDFNEKAFVNANSYSSDLDALVQYIIELDQNDEEYLKILHEKPMSKNFNENEMEDFEKFLIEIITRGNRPITKDPLLFAKRMSVDSLSRKDKLKYFFFK